MSVDYESVYNVNEQHTYIYIHAYIYIYADTHLSARRSCMSLHVCVSACRVWTACNVQDALKGVHVFWCGLQESQNPKVREPGPPMCPSKAQKARYSKDRLQGYSSQADRHVCCHSHGPIEGRPGCYSQLSPKHDDTPELRQW